MYEMKDFPKFKTAFARVFEGEKQSRMRDVIISYVYSTVILQVHECHSDYYKSYKIE